MMTELKRAGGNELAEFKELLTGRTGAADDVTHRDGTYTCIFCGASFDTGVIYHSRGRDVTAERRYGSICRKSTPAHSGPCWSWIRRSTV